MKITCQACSAKYTIADDKVRGRKVKIRCKGCGTPIVVDGQKTDAGEGLVGTPSMSDPPPAGAAPAEPIPAPPQAPAIAEIWNVNLSDTDSRTMTADEIVAGWSSGLVTSDAFVWKDGMADWVAILDCPEIASRLGTPAAAAPTGTPYGPPVMLAPQVAAQAAAAAPAPAGFPQLDAKAPAGAARLAGGRSNTADLFGGVESAGSEQDVVMSPHASALPTAPGSTAYGDDKMTGARNENSVLFSLDSLKAGFAAGPAPAAGPGKAPPKAPSARSAQTSNPDDPFGMGGTSPIMASPGGNALFSLADNNALLTAPAPPEPPPVVAVSSDLGGGTAPTPAQKRKQMIMIGGIVAGVLIMGIVLGLALGGGDKEEAKNEGAPSAQAGSDLVKDKADKPEEKKEEPKAEEPKPEEKKEEPKPEEKKEEAAAKADTAKKGGSGGSVKKEAKKEEPAPGPTTDAPFSKASAISALSAAAAQAGGCKKPGGPTGSGKVQVTFAPSGRVTTANISGPPFAGTAVGGCIAGAFRRAKVPPFAGNPVTVQKSFSVN